MKYQIRLKKGFGPKQVNGLRVYVHPLSLLASLIDNVSLYIPNKHHKDLDKLIYNHCNTNCTIIKLQFFTSPGTTFDHTPTIS